MADQYLTISTIAGSWTMTQRITACAAQQAQDTPETWTAEHRWDWASTPNWATQWDYAVETHPPVEGEIYDPGADQTVITDQDILTRVQQLLGTS